MLLISILLKKYMKNKYVQSALNGIKFVAVALIAASALTIFADVLFPYSLENGISVIPNRTAIKMFIIIIAGYFLLKIVLKKKPGPISIIIMSAIVGLMVNYL